MIESINSRSFMVVPLSQPGERYPVSDRPMTPAQSPTPWENRPVLASAAVFPTERLAPVLADSEDSRVPTIASHRRFLLDR
jgi:hypothetical protein